VIAAGLLAAAVTSLTPTSAAIFAGDDATGRSRFLPGTREPNPAFTLAEFDLSGVGVGTNGGVLISDRHVLAANHFRGGAYAFVNAVGQTVTISASRHTRLTTDLPPGGPLNYPPSPFEPSSRGSDLTVATLSRPVTAADRLLPLRLADLGVDELAGEIVYAYDQNDQLGRNRIDGGEVLRGGRPEPVPAVGLYGDETEATWAIGYDFDTSTNGGSGGVGDDEIGLVGFDSGHAALIVEPDGRLSVLGTHFAVISYTETSGTSPEDPYVSLSSYVTPYLSQIEALVRSDGGTFEPSWASQASPVPEPGVAGIGTVAVGLLLRRRRG